MSYEKTYVQENLIDNNKPIGLNQKYFGLLVLSIFIMNGSWIFNSALFYFTKRPLNQIVHLIFLVLSISAGMFTFILYLGKSGVKKVKGNGIIGGVFSVIVIILFISVSAIMAQFWSKYAIPFMMKEGMENDYIGGLVFLALCFIICVLFIILINMCFIYLKYNINLNAIGKASSKALIVLMKQIHKVIFHALLFLLIAVVFYFLNDVIKSLLSKILPAIYLSNYLLFIIMSILSSIIVIYLIFVNEKLFIKYNQEFITLSNNENKRNIPIYPFIMLVLVITLAIVSIPGSIEGMNTLLSSLEYRMYKADMMFNEGDEKEAISEYIRIEADIDSAIKFLERAISIKNKEEVGYGISSKHIYPLCAIDDYFNVILDDAKGKDNYNEERLAYHTHTIPEAALWAFRYYKNNDDKENAYKMFNQVIVNAVYVDKYTKVLKYRKSKLNKKLEKALEVQTMIQDRHINTFIEKANYMDKVLLYKEVIGYIDGKAVNPDYYALIAELAYESAQGDFQYEIMKEYAYKYFEAYTNQGEKVIISGLTEKEIIEAINFVTLMLYRSFNYEEAVSFAEKQYNQYQNNNDMALIYANALMENREHKKAIEILENIVEDSSYRDYLLAINYLEADNYEASIQYANNLETKIENATEEEIDELDFYIYGYILACNNYFEVNTDTSSEEMGEKLINLLLVVNNAEKNSIAYINFMGINYWFTHQYDESNKMFEKIIQKHPGLSYPYLMIGVNYLEKEEVEKVDLSRESETYFLEYIKRQPNSEEAYFCLGHIYKHDEDVKRANRAFRKVIEIVPYDNSDYDKWGISHHTKVSIRPVEEEGE